MKKKIVSTEFPALYTIFKPFVTKKQKQPVNNRITSSDIYAYNAKIKYIYGQVYVRI